MKVYKRSTWEMIKGLILAPFAAFIVIIVGGFFTENMTILYGVSAVVVGLIILSTIFGENIGVELDDNGTMRYLKKGKVTDTFDLTHCAAGYRRKSDRSLLATHNIQLQIVDNLTGQETFLDCSPLGVNQFYKLYEDIGRYTKEEPEVLQA